MKDPLIFVSVSVEKELPKEDGKYFCYAHGLKQVLHYNDGNHALWKDTDTWLRELSLPELMEEQTNEYNTRVANGTIQGLTLKEFINDFITQKGIL